MTATYSSVVNAPQDEVFAWHERPGAIQRLSPPWFPGRIEQEAVSLRDGTAILAFPLGLRWVAQHSEYQPPARFVDELDGLAAGPLPLGPVRRALSWRHQHEFEPVGDGDRTRVTDRIDTTVPGFVLRPMLHYRHRQLAADLSALHRARAAGDSRSLTVAVSGSSGTIGSALISLLTTAGHEVVRLVRRSAQSADERRWDPESPAPDLLTGVDAIIHLAGAPIGGRFTEQRRLAMHRSRVPATRALAELAARTPDGPTVFVCASAIGYYGPDRGEEILTETSERGEGFLAELVHQWEQATEPAQAAGLRVVNLRTGLVQTPRGGILQLQYPLFAAGLGGRLGDGDQWQPWIAIDDLTDIYHRALYDEQMSGPVNAVAPNPVRNRDYTRTLAHVLHRPAVIPVPSLGPRLLLGRQGNEQLAQANQHVVPAHLTGTGHTFRYPTLEPALRHLLGKDE